eukprot:scaffold33220_cov51-Isochrysis_galbana.AAC.1
MPHDEAAAGRPIFGPAVLERRIEIEGLGAHVEDEEEEGAGGVNAPHLWGAVGGKGEVRAG